MFTGIIENTGIVKEVITTGSNKTFWINSPLWNELKVDQSLSHNGVCLTIEEIKEGCHRVTAIEETLKKTNLGHWQAGTPVNLERCMQMNGRLDGHIVQGHVDTVSQCQLVTEKDGSWEFSFSFDEAFAALVIEKGSITLNGISLTLFNITQSGFSVGIIPYTYHHTNLNTVKKGDWVNIEFDIIGKYIQRMTTLHINPII
ncbi:MAG: riboflavin synthase [Ferruginibacter sp.]